MNKPVSVCIPVYNHGQYIGAAIESVLRQTYADFELIVVDNCSEDDTVEVVNGFVKADRRVRLFVNDRNLGMVGNWNRCLSLARHPFIKLLCSDDVLLPTCLERGVSLLGTNDRVGLVACRRGMVDATLTGLGELGYSDQSLHENGEVVGRRCLINGNLIGEPSAVIFRKEHARQEFDTQLRQLTDLDMWLQVLSNSDFQYDNEVLCLFRQHEQQCTKQNKGDEGFIRENFFIFEKYKHFVSSTSPLFRFLVRNNLCVEAWKQTRAGYNKDTVKTLIESQMNLGLFFALFPFRRLLFRYLK